MKKGGWGGGYISVLSVTEIVVWNSLLTNGKGDIKFILDLSF